MDDKILYMIIGAFIGFIPSVILLYLQNISNRKKDMLFRELSILDDVAKLAHLILSDIINGRENYKIAIERAHELESMVKMDFPMLEKYFVDFISIVHNVLACYRNNTTTNLHTFISELIPKFSLFAISIRELKKELRTPSLIEKLCVKKIFS